VELVGACNDVPKFLGELDIAVLCSHSEGMSNALLEYMAAGRIIIATNVGANATLVGDGRHGRIIPPGDDAALASAILTSIRERERSQEMAVAAQQRANEDFGRAKMVRRFENLYRELVSRVRRPMPTSSREIEGWRMPSQSVPSGTDWDGC
jgi:L-malate glycosyltransferase